KKEQGTTMLSSKKKLKMPKKRVLFDDLQENLTSSTERYASLPATSAEENVMFLDILHEAPLFAHRKPARVFGSVFYCILLASSNLFFVGYTTLAIGAEWIFCPKQEVISPVLCSCDVLLLLLIGFFLALLLFPCIDVLLIYFSDDLLNCTAFLCFCIKGDWRGSKPTEIVI
ncbi:hypothetical protein S83_051492, partial [Arachis hypogaea]